MRIDIRRCLDILVAHPVLHRLHVPTLFDQEYTQAQYEWEERSARPVHSMECANLSTSESSPDAEASAEVSEPAAAMQDTAFELVVPAMPAAPASTIAAIPDDEDTVAVATTMSAPSEQESSGTEE